MAATDSDTELIRRSFEAYASDGVEAMLEFVHPDFEMETLPGIAAEPQVYRGHEGVRLWFSSFYEVMDEVFVEPTAYEPYGPGKVLMDFKLRAKGHASGIEVEQEAKAIGTVRDGLMYRLEFLMPGEEPPPPES